MVLWRVGLAEGRLQWTPTLHRGSYLGYSLLIVDIFYAPGPILADVHPIEAFVGVSAILLMAIVVAGIIHGGRTRASRLEPGSGMTLVAYVILMYMIFSAGA